MESIITYHDRMGMDLLATLSKQVDCVFSILLTDPSFDQSSFGNQREEEIEKFEENQRFTLFF